MKNFVRSLLLVISIASVANAQLVPGGFGPGGPGGGPGHGGPGPGNPGPGPGGPGGGGIVPGPSHPGPGGPGPGFPGGPGPGPGFPGHGPDHDHGPGHGHGPGYPYPQPYPPQPYPPQPYPQPYPQPQPQPISQIRRIYVGRNVFNEQIDLRAGAGLYDSYYYGSRIVSVRANTSPNSPSQTVAQLLMDGRAYATQVNPGYQIVLYPQASFYLDRNVRSVALSISGGTYINTIDVEISSY